MIQLTPQMRILIAVEPVDFRLGIDGVSRVCREALSSDPYSGAVFVFRSRRGAAIKLLAYDGQGYWMCQKRLSKGRFVHWPRSEAAGEKTLQLLAHEVQALLVGGNPRATQAAGQWRSVTPNAAA